MSRGNFAIVLLWPSVFFAVASCGLAEAFGYVALRAERAALKRMWLWLNTIAGTAIAVLGYCLLPSILSSTELVTLTRMGLLFIPMNFVITSGLAILQSCGELRAFNVSRVSFSVAYLAGITFVVISGAVGVSSYLAVFLGATGVTTLLTTYHVLRLRAAVGVSSETATDRELLQTIVRYGLMCHASGVLRMTNEKLDQIVISITSSATTLGLYTVATSFASPVAAVGNAFATIVFREAALQGNLERADEAIARRLRQTICVSVVVAFVGIGSAPWALPLLLGESFVPAVSVADVCLVAAVFSGIGLVLRTGLRAVNELGIILAAETGLSLVLPILLLLLIPRLQGIGAALAVLFGYAGTATITLCLMKLHGARQVGRLHMSRSDLEPLTIEPLRKMWRGWRTS